MSKTTRPLICLPLLILLPILAACSGGSHGDRTASDPPDVGDPAPTPVYRPPADLDDGWLVGNALELGADEAALESFVTALEKDRAWADIDAVSIAWRGRLVYGRTLRTETDAFDEEVGNADPALHAQFSVSKSVASLLTGIAIGQGVIASVEVPYLSLFDYPEIENMDDRKAAVRLVDVLTMTAGFAWNEWQPPYDDPDNQLFSFHREHYDWSKGLLDLPMADEPGTRFVYNTVAATSLGQAIANRSPLALIDFATTYLAAPLRIAAVEVLRTPTGLPDLGRGLYVSSRDIAKIGQVMLDGGRWNGQQIVPTDYVAASVENHVDLGWLEPDAWDWDLVGYGYLWWIGGFEVDGVRYDSFAARGNGEQTVMVVPALDLVIAVNAGLYGAQNDDRNQVFRMMRDGILPAFTVD